MKAEDVQYNLDSITKVFTDSLYQSKIEVNKLSTQMDSLMATIEKSTSLVNESATFDLNNIWILISTGLVFIMHLGFALIESGLTRAKNTISVLYKNVMVLCIGFLTYTAIGHSLMFPDVSFEGIIGFSGLGIKEPEVFNENYSFWTRFLFQAMFASTAATIVSGAIVGRMKKTSFVFFTCIFLAFCYPILASWIWGGGWLSTRGFHDFAGSTVVHAMGGIAALVGAILVGPRLGKFFKNDKGTQINPIPGHSMTSACTGALLLWFGWLGFNGGSVLSSDGLLISKVLTATMVAGAAGGITAAISINIIDRTIDFSMVLNGILAGLVAITAGADVMSIYDALVVGGIAGILVVISSLFIERIGIDDPVGASSVHLVCGVWGTIAVGLFGTLASPVQLGTQIIGVFSVVLTAGIFSLILWAILKISIQLRVPEETEIYGIDVKEHGVSAYSFTTREN